VVCGVMARQWSREGCTLSRLASSPAAGVPACLARAQRVSRHRACPAPAASPARATGHALSGGAPSEKAANFSLEDVFRRAGLEPENSVLRRMRQRFAARVLLLLQGGSPEEAHDLYRDAASLPSLTTGENLRVAGWRLHGPLHENSVLTICYKGVEPHVVKPLDRSETSRLREFLGAFASDGGPSHPALVRMQLWEDAGKGKAFLLMPLMQTSLEPIVFLEEADALRLWTQLSDALAYLHSHGFVHMDVKPSNICVHNRDFVLIDLGSVHRFGGRTTSTAAYVPRDVSSRTASTAVDWWMLAMTMAEKCCGEEHGMPVGSGPVSASRAQLVSHLRTHLPPAVWEAMQRVLLPLCDD
jgi:hypothetical protein